MSQTASPALPLFYRNPELLDAGRHGDLRVADRGYGFAARTNSAPLTAIEFGQASRHYPIAFAANDGFPVAILGLDRSNRFVSDGAWTARTYIPAYVRRYPFVFAEQGDDSLALAIDRDADHFATGADEGEALFANGEPTGTARNILAFCRDFHGAIIQTNAFAAALVQHDLLIDRRADAKLDSGRKLTLSGFKVVDRTRFDALPHETVLDWHRRGWLALIHFHFLSLDRFADLVDAEAAAGDEAAPSSAAAAAA